MGDGEVMENAKQSSLTVYDIDVNALVPYEDNTNEMDDATFNRLAEEITEVGFIDPLQVIPIDGGKYKIMGGHHRWQAAKAIGMEYVPCTVLSDKKWTDNDLYELVSFRLNAIKGRVNAEKFAKVYEKMSSKFGEEALQNIFAVTDNEVWEKLTTSVRRSLQEAGVPKEMVEKFKEAEKNIKTVDDLARILNTLFTDYGDTVPYNFMFFNFGKNDHLMIQASKGTFKATKVICDKAYSRREDVNKLLEPAFVELSEKVKDLPEATVMETANGQG